jgi:hypothetical protein
VSSGQRYGRRRGQRAADRSARSSVWWRQCCHARRPGRQPCTSRSDQVHLLKAYIEASRLGDARRLLGARRPSTSGIPVMGVAAVHLTGIEIEPTCRHPRAPQRHLRRLRAGTSASGLNLRSDRVHRRSACLADKRGANSLSFAQTTSRFRLSATPICASVPLFEPSISNFSLNRP